MMLAMATQIHIKALLGHSEHKITSKDANKKGNMIEIPEDVRWESVISEL